MKVVILHIDSDGHGTLFATVKIGKEILQLFSAPQDEGDWFLIDPRYDRTAKCAIEAVVKALQTEIEKRKRMTTYIASIDSGAGGSIQIDSPDEPQAWETAKAWAKAGTWDEDCIILLTLRGDDGLSFATHLRVKKNP